MRYKRDKILLLGASIPSAMAVARSLSDYGLEITIIDWYKLPIKRSRFINNYLNIGSPSEDESAFAKNLIEVLQKNQYKCLLPVNDPALEICMKHRIEIGSLTQILQLNKEEIYEFAHDKRKLLKMALEHEIDIPDSHFCAGVDDLNNILGKVAFPCIVKPAFSSVIKNNKVLEFKVRIAATEEELIDFTRELVYSTPLIIQELVKGYGIGFNFIARQGEILNAYVHRRIIELSGVSSYRESMQAEAIPIYTRIVRLIKQMNWTGVGMLEFKVNSDRYYLMELNGRFWGSLEVGLRSGLNLPVQLYRMQAENAEVEKVKFVKRVKVRNHHMEVLYYFNQVKELKFIKFFKWLFSYRRIFKANEFIEDSLFRDPKYIVDLYWADIKRFLLKLKIRRYIKKRVKIRYIATSNQKIAFVCSGNICRSPFAERYAKKIYPSHQFSSFGFVHQEERLPPLNAVKAAAKFSVDLNDFKSSCFSKDRFGAMDYFIVMDRSNYESLIKHGIDRDKIYFLSNKDITDPYGKSLKDFEYTFALIKKKIDVLFERKIN